MIRRLVVVSLAILATVGVYLVARSMDVELLIPASFGEGDATTPMPLSMVLGFTVALGLLGWVLAEVLDRATTNGRNVWAVIAAVVMIGGLPPVFQLGLTTAGLVFQVALHLVFGLILIIGFWPTFDGPKS